MNKTWLGSLILLLFALILSGCFASNMVQLSPDTYMIRVEDHGGIFAFNRGKLKSSAIQQANDFAASKGKIAIPVAIDSHPVGILGDWAAVEYQFRVVSKDDPEAKRTSLTPRPDIVIEKTSEISADIEIKDQTEKTKDVYTELIKLDDLRKKGIITEAEFETQKRKLLGGN
ncbi:MAG: SHOCT domain-containing protein [Nitrospirota bacterium]